MLRDVILNSISVIIVALVSIVINFVAVAIAIVFVDVTLMQLIVIMVMVCTSNPTHKVHSVYAHVYNASPPPAARAW